VNINPAYKSYELEYSLNKVKCKALIMSESYKTQNYVQTVLSLCPEVAECKPGELKSKKFPHLKHIITIGHQNVK
jgi:fatty-acyl-CoA synthase